MISSRKEINVLVAEAQVDLNRLISMYINGKDNIRVIDSVYDGKSAYDKILEHRPDVALVDTILSVLDGLAIMEKSFADKELYTRFIVLSSINDPLITQECFNIGASYYMLKPIDLEVLARRIRLVNRSDLTENRPGTFLSDNERLQNNHINIEIIKLLLSINIPSHLNGYQYLQEAIRMTVYNSDYVHQVTKFIYPGLAKKFNSTPDRVERSIRNAIDQVWSTENVLLQRTFSTRPTNTQFISWVSEKVRIENGLVSK